MSSRSAPSFPHAQQAQIIRANQRDVFHISSLKEQSENIFRAFLGTRSLARWDKELDLIVRLIYYGFTIGRATQTLGEEYTNIWQYFHPRRRLPPPTKVRLALVLVPTLLPYVVAKRNHLIQPSTLPQWLVRFVTLLPEALSIAFEINLAVFYLRGTYYDVMKRALRIQYVSPIPENPHIRPPSYSLLGVLIIIRLLHRLITVIRQHVPLDSISQKSFGETDQQQMFLDDRPVSSLIDHTLSDSEATKSAEDDEGTMLDVAAIPPGARTGRNCTLCLEERTNTCSTECGHLFCWECIFGWGREKVNYHPGFCKRFMLTPHGRLNAHCAGKH